MDSSDDEEDLDLNEDEELAAPSAKTHKFSIDFFVRYPDESDDLILHWGMSRKKVGAWGTPD